MFQIIQETRNDVIFNFIPSDKYSDKTINEIRFGLISRLGELNFTINKLKEIKRNENSGKIRCIINKIC